MTQYGFFIDLSRCTGCNACVIACKQWYDIAPGLTKWIRVYQWEKGIFPDIDLRVLPIMCFHCENPLCLASCPNGAIFKEPKYGAVLVNREKCTGERKCWDSCPYGTPQFASDDSGQKMSKCNMCIDRLEKGLKPLCVLSCSLRALEFGPIEELKAKYGDTKKGKFVPTGVAPCRLECPLGIDIEKYLSSINQGQNDEATRIMGEMTPFAGVLGRVCTHACEAGCLRGKFDDAVSIRSMHRFLGDVERHSRKKKKESRKITRADSVAVVGSGPAGLSCAYDLIRLGYPVTVFESEDQTGGLLRWGIPEYRLPRNILQHEIENIKKLGVELKTHTQVKSLADLRKQGFKAILLATGLGGNQKMGIPEQRAFGVIYASSFLHDSDSGQKLSPGNKVVVVGGGNSAIDSARVALRLGAKQVSLLYRRSPSEITADSSEIKAMVQEGVTIRYQTTPVKVLTGGERLRAIQCIHLDLGEPDASGRRKPVPVNGSEFEMEADTLIIAVGQTLDPKKIPQEVANMGTNTLAVDDITLQTCIKDVFAAGDMVTGPADVVSAVTMGKKAAISIDRYLNGKDLVLGRLPMSGNLMRRSGYESEQPPSIALSRRKTFAEVNLGFNADEAIAQTNKCLKCGTLNPSVVIKPIDAKKQIISWDSNKALKLWQKRHPANCETLPDVINDVSRVTQDSSDIMSRNKLILKAKNAEELLANTTDDE